MVFDNIDPPFNYTFNHKTKTVNDGSIKLCKSVENISEHTLKKCGVVNQYSLAKKFCSNVKIICKNQVLG